MPIASGTRFGPYEIISAAGAGGMGEVYRAKDTRLDRVVAIKVLPSQLAGDPEKRQRFEREARTISTFSHQHICTLHDIGHQGGVDYLVLEYLNYCFALLESETRLAISALGLDPGLGMGLHTDTANRDSLAFDVLEPVRPQVEAWLLDWIAREPLRRVDFFETATGNCRLMSRMCSRLSQTTSVWEKLVAPWAEYVARTLWEEAKSGRSHNSVPPTRLTQQRRIEARGKVWTAALEQPKADHLCRGCGKTIAMRRTHCSHCSIDSSTTRMVDAARLGRLTANSPQANGKRAHIARQNATAQHSWLKSSQPRWLTDQLYSQKIQPLLANISTSVIASSIGVSRCYAGNIRKGRFRPHPRHWQALAKLAGIAPVLQVVPKILSLM